MLRSIGKQSGESVESVRKKVGYGGKELQKWKVLSLEWKSEGVMDDESGEAEFERLVQGWQREAGSWFQRRGEAYWKELSVTNMCMDERMTKDEERVLRGGWTVMRLCRYEGWVVARTL